MVVTLCLNVSVCHQKHGENDGDDIPTGEDKSGKVKEGGGKSLRGKMCLRLLKNTYVKVLATSPICSGSYHAEKATIKGICNKQT